MPSLFRRKPTDLVEEATAPVADPSPESAPAQNPDAVPAPDADAAAERRPRRHTPSKRELGRVTPKRSDAQRRRTEPPPANRREAARRMRERQRAERAEATAGMRRGDEKYLLPRDRGPERALVRDIVDSRRTVGTWFFGGAVVVLIGSSSPVPLIRLLANLLWALLALGVVADSVLICRRIGRLVGQRFPHSTQRRRSLYMYGIMRSITFRRMRVPQARVGIGEAI